MRKFILLSVIVFFAVTCKNTKQDVLNKKSITISKEILQDKIKGGWAGQVIGCTYGGPTEFKFNGCFIHDYTPIVWDSSRMTWYYKNAPGLYDDVYMDLTFVDVFDRLGLEAPVDSFAMAYANAKYELWHANQAGRYNILNGIMPPFSGHWHNNPHADCIDFQIEADFAGLMSPGMVNTSAEICDKIGHIMNYGDGWYGGVYVAAMYSLAFISNDINYIVTEALKVIPAESKFYQVINDVINWHKQYPDDWKRTWFEVEKKWSEDISCPDGIYRPFNIDATINCAYVIIGLLYGQGDYTKTLDISTRCGQDSDCNPATAGGILGTMIGYSAIPDYWKQGIDKVEDIDFNYTTLSLNDVYKIGFNHALAVIKKNGGVEENSVITINIQKPKVVKFEKSFEGIKLAGSIPFALSDKEPIANFEFAGCGFIIRSGWFNVYRNKEYATKNVDLEITIDGKTELIKLPLDVIKRKTDIYWNYTLQEQKHQVTVKWINPDSNINLLIRDVVYYQVN